MANTQLCPQGLIQLDQDSPVKQLAFDTQTLVVCADIPDFDLLAPASMLMYNSVLDLGSDPVEQLHQLEDHIDRRLALTGGIIGMPAVSESVLKACSDLARKQDAQTHLLISKRAIGSVYDLDSGSDCSEKGWDSIVVCAKGRCNLRSLSFS